MRKKIRNYLFNSKIIYIFALVNKIIKKLNFKINTPMNEKKFYVMCTKTMSYADNLTEAEAIKLASEINQKGGMATVYLKK